MAGVKGRSGGARPGSGGARPGAGRKPNPPRVPAVSDIKNGDTLKLLQDIAFGRLDATPTQLKAAIAAVQYTHPKKGEGGKKEQRQDAANKVVGNFRPSAPPKLVSVK